MTPWLQLPTGACMADYVQLTKPPKHGTNTPAQAATPLHPFKGERYCPAVTTTHTVTTMKQIIFAAIPVREWQHLPGAMLEMPCLHVTARMPRSTHWSQDEPTKVSMVCFPVLGKSVAGSSARHDQVRPPAPTLMRDCCFSAAFTSAWVTMGSSNCWGGAMPPNPPWYMGGGRGG